MRKSILLIAVIASLAPAYGQAPVSDDALLAKSRDLYDAPFTRNLVSFDCSVDFDWTTHFKETLGTVPAAAVATIERLQTIHNRVFVDRTGAVVSAVPKAPGLSAIPHASDLEQALNSMVTGGLNTWIPFATNVILPVKPTKFSFQKSDGGYRITMTGNGVDGVLQLLPDLRLTGGTTKLPQQMRFSTVFVDGPNGYMLGSITTETPANSDGGGEAKFTFKFQPVQGFQIPAEVRVNVSASETWHFVLSDCNVKTGITMNVAPPPTVH
jgi:hypothetical protein